MAKYDDSLHILGTEYIYSIYAPWGLQPWKRKYILEGRLDSALRMHAWTTAYVVIRTVIESRKHEWEAEFKIQTTRDW